MISTAAVAFAPKEERLDWARVNTSPKNPSPPKLKHCLLPAYKPKLHVLCSGIWGAGIPLRLFLSIPAPSLVLPGAN